MRADEAGRAARGRVMAARVLGRRVSGRSSGRQAHESDGDQEDPEEVSHAALIDSRRYPRQPGRRSQYERPDPSLEQTSRPPLTHPASDHDATKAASPAPPPPPTRRPTPPPPPTRPPGPTRRPTPPHPQTGREPSVTHRRSPSRPQAAQASRTAPVKRPP